MAPARKAKGKDIWMMGGGDIIASFLDEGVPLELRSVKSFPDGVVQVHYSVGKAI